MTGGAFGPPYSCTEAERGGRARRAHNTDTQPQKVSHQPRFASHRLTPRPGQMPNCRRPMGSVRVSTCDEQSVAQQMTSLENGHRDCGVQQTTLVSRSQRREQIRGEISAMLRVLTITSYVFMGTGAILLVASLAAATKTSRSMSSEDSANELLQPFQAAPDTQMLSPQYLSPLPPTQPVVPVTPPRVPPIMSAVAIPLGPPPATPVRTAKALLSPAVPLPSTPPHAPPPPNPPSPRLPLAPFCLDNLRADGVTRRDEGSYGTTDPMLWVFREPNNFDTVQKTEPVMDTLTPEWTSLVCMDSVELASHGPCFEIRDDFDPGFPPDRPPLLHVGCAIGSLNWGTQSIELSEGATVHFAVVPRMPASPPRPPASPPLPRPDRTVDRLNALFRSGTATNNLSQAGTSRHPNGMLSPNHLRLLWTASL